MGTRNHERKYLSRFNETEIVAILAILIPRYKIEVMDEQEFSGETFDERKARIFKSKPGITQTLVTC